MKFILDTNILLSALIKNSTTRKIIVKSNWDFYYPEMSFHEIRKYKDLILKKLKMSDIDYLSLLNYLLKYINLVPNERILDKLSDAKKIMSHIGTDDVVFIATNLSILDSIIWTDDTHFEKQNKVKFIKSSQVCRLFENNEVKNVN